MGDPVSPWLVALVAVPVVICCIPPVAFATGAFLMGAAVCIPACCIGCCVLPCAATAQCCCPPRDGDDSFPPGHQSFHGPGTYYEYRYWSPWGSSREAGQDFGNGTFLIVNERVFRDVPPSARNNNSGVRIEELNPSAAESKTGLIEDKKSK